MRIPEFKLQQTLNTNSIKVFKGNHRIRPDFSSFSKYLVAIVICFALGMAKQAEASSSYFDLSSWTAHTPGWTSSNANWTFSNNNRKATQTLNGNPSYLLSNQNFGGNYHLRGSFNVSETLNVPNGNGDDDYIGFVSGFQDDGDHYLFKGNGIFT